MRTIKFRGKDIQTGEWVYGSLFTGVYPNDKKPYYVILTDEKYDAEGYLPKDVALGFLADEVHIVTSGSVGQFTGLKDKNGKDIYEGDIMNDPTSMRVGVVEWNSILCQFQLSWQNMHTAADLFFMVKCGSFLIGNIHANPELLTKK